MNISTLWAEYIAPIFASIAGFGGIIVAVFYTLRNKKTVLKAAKETVGGSISEFAKLKMEILSELKDTLKAPITVAIEDLVEGKLRAITNITDSWQQLQSTGQYQIALILQSIAETISRNPHTSKSQRDELSAKVGECLSLLETARLNAHTPNQTAAVRYQTSDAKTNTDQAQTNNPANQKPTLKLKSRG